MPPRFTYWTIIAGGQPTAFRAATQDELLPTLRQLQSKQPDAVLMWFARGKLWPSEEASAMALRMEREGAARERRGPDWRPGGEHKDPRDRFKVPRDVKRSQFAARARRERIEEQGGGAKSDRPPGPRPGRPAGPAGPRSARPQGQQGRRAHVRLDRQGQQGPGAHVRLGRQEGREAIDRFVHAGHGPVVRAAVSAAVPPAAADPAAVPHAVEVSGAVARKAAAVATGAEDADRGDRPRRPDSAEDGHRAFGRRRRRRGSSDGIQGNPFNQAPARRRARSPRLAGL